MSLAQLAAPNLQLTRTHGIVFRRATVNDATAIANHRAAMFRDIGYSDETALSAMRRKFLLWVEPRLKSGQYRAWLASTGDGCIVAGVGLWLMEWPAHMLGASSRRGNILNVYTEPAYRRRGLARLLIEAALHWCKTNEIDLVVLHASQEGRGLYESLGFTPSNEMHLQIREG